MFKILCNCMLDCDCALLLTKSLADQDTPTEDLMTSINGL